MIQPTVGRVVWYTPAKDEMPIPNGGKCAAIITAVWSDTCVNLTVFDANGNSHGRTSVFLAQPESEAPGQCYCEWMPYQVKKDHGSESGEKSAGTVEV